jgi:hypothetical protein
MKNSFLLATIALVGTLSQAAFADATAKLIWSDSKGFVSAANCVSQWIDDTAFRVSEKPRHTRILARVKPGATSEPMINSISDYVITSIRSGNTRTIGKTGIRLTSSFWQASMNGAQFNVLMCGSNKNPYLLFDVFAPGTTEPVAQIGVNQKEINIFSDMRIDKTDEAQAELIRMGKAGTGTGEPSLSRDPSRPGDDVDHGQTTGQATGQTPDQSPIEGDDQSGEADSRPVIVAPVIDEVICLSEGHLSVRDQKLKSVLFEASDLERVTTLTKSSDPVLSLKLDGVKVPFIKVKFLDRDAGEDVGFVASQYVTSKIACRANPVHVAPTPAPVTQLPTPKPTPKPMDDSSDLLAPNCAEKIILKAAKESVASKWGNRSHSHGLCALGVRYSLQHSKIGDVQGGLGNAVDYVSNLESHGFVDSGLRDIDKAPAGAILVFEGANTPSYFRTGHFGRPAGNWLGHVTIKGGDGFYYTDGRTRDPAIGWSGTRNVAHIRNLMAIMIPGHGLISENSSSCSGR